MTYKHIFENIDNKLLKRVDPKDKWIIILYTVPNFLCPTLGKENYFFKSTKGSISTNQNNWIDIF